MIQRYDMRRESNGWWAVIDRATEEPIILGEMVMNRLAHDEADDAVVLLNTLDRRQTARPEH
jgi:acyl-ACP thioesterase